MPATEHVTIPKPFPTPKDEPPSPRKPSEPLRPLQPTSLHVAVEPLKPKDILPDRDAKSPIEPPKKSVTPQPQPPSTEAEVPDQEPGSPVREVVDMETFNQILELDEDEDSHDFSQPMVWDYFEQAEKTFKTMDDAFAKEDLESLSSLGHFLKGSSAALGLSRVQHTCEEIQHVGHLRDEKAEKDLKPSEALTVMGRLLKRVKVEYKEAQAWMKKFYGED